MYIEKDSVRFFLRVPPAAFFLEGVFFGGIVMCWWWLSVVGCLVEGFAALRLGLQNSGMHFRTDSVEN